jgi:hypothetical protein
VAGQIIVSSIKTDSDNSISFVSNTGATIFSANLASGLSIDSFGDNTITSDKIVSVANTKIAGNIVSSQITSVANTQLTGTVTSAQVGSSVYEGMGMRNRIINGDMRIAQRGTTANPTTTGYYTVDRWQQGATSSLIAAIAPVNEQSTDAPSGFVNSFKYTNTNASGTLTGTQTINVNQAIEGTNVSDLAWGTASAKTVTLSFWVRSSLTGTFAVQITNSALDRSYPATYTISVADTWEYKSVIIPGDTTGTWLTDTGVGVRVRFSLGVGPDRRGTANAWAAGNVSGATGMVQLTETAGATWQVTGVQLEVGSVATPFERRPYGTELVLCQRYYEKSFSQVTAPANSYSESILRNGYGGWIAFGGASVRSGTQKYAVVKRASPTITTYNSNIIGTAGEFGIYVSGSWNSTTGLAPITNDCTFAFEADSTVGVTVGQSYLFAGGWAASAEL